MNEYKGTIRIRLLKNDEVLHDEIINATLKVSEYGYNAIYDYNIKCNSSETLSIGPFIFNDGLNLIELRDKLINPNIYEKI